METGPWKQEPVEPVSFQVGLTDDKLAKEEPGLFRDICQRNLLQISMALLQYIQDYDEKFPPASSWIDSVRAYLPNESFFHCPEGGGEYGYAFNRHLSTLSIAQVRHPSTTVMVYETKVRRRNHSGIGNDIDYRHEDGSFVAYCDGHASWRPKDHKLDFKP
ncbi:MAG: hypothetical protein NZ959_10640 [Armatimonadetes bacterium]|nr:hypothetical protein [Armatimonadota bacterium]MDW8121127.1 hypothetical protein [Armatimonadota bacterium]